MLSSLAEYRSLSDSAQRNGERADREGVRQRQERSQRSSLQGRTAAHFWAVSLLLLCFPFLYLLLTHSTGLALPNFPLKMRRPTRPHRILRVMTFNIWLSGERVNNGLAKIAQQIKSVDPDIVALQELESPAIAQNLTRLLDPTIWKIVHHPYASYPDTAIVTRHKFVSEDEVIGLQFKRDISDFLFHEHQYANHSTVTYGTGVGIELQPDKQRVNFFSMHLDWKSYGPYAANNKMVTSDKQIMAGERNKEGYGRGQNIEQLLNNDGFKAFMAVSDSEPLIVAGDFNCPSHLDWGDETKHLHGGWSFEWPATKLMIDAGFNDSFRHLHPDVLQNPGITWSTVQKSVGPEWDWQIPEPQDRIDFILYKPNARFRPISSHTFCGKGSQPPRPIPGQWENEWPSDHFAVVTEFQLDLEEVQTSNDDVRAAEMDGDSVK